jgi:hypothetical protein
MKTILMGKRCILFSILSILGASVNLHAAVDGLPGTDRSFKEYRNPTDAFNNSGTNIMSGAVPRFVSTFSPLNRTNATSVITPLSLSFTTNFTVPDGDVSRSSTGTFSFDFGVNSRALTVKDMVINTRFNGILLPFVDLVLTHDAKSQIFYQGVQTFTGPVSGSPHTADITFTSHPQGTVLTSACASTFRFRTSWTNDITQEVLPCPGVPRGFGVFSNDDVGGTWSISFVNDSVVTGNPPVNISQPLTVLSFTVTVVANEASSVTIDGRSIDLRSRSVRAKDFSVVNPNGSTETRLPRFQSER